LKINITCVLNGQNIEEIPILGVIVGKGQVKMEQEKIKAIKE